MDSPWRKNAYDDVPDFTSFGMNFVFAWNPRGHKWISGYEWGVFIENTESELASS